MEAFDNNDKYFNDKFKKYYNFNQDMSSMDARRHLGAKTDEIQSCYGHVKSGFQILDTLNTTQWIRTIL
jgi:hypothetical protein